MGVKLGVIWSGPAKAALLATALVHARHVDTARATKLWRLACAAHFQIEERRVVLSKVEDACREARGHRELQRLQLNAQRFQTNRFLKLEQPNYASMHGQTETTFLRSLEKRGAKLGKKDR